MVAQLLHRCGLYLGRQDQISASGSDNPDGYWEHRGFRAINERILGTFGGGWDLPPSMSAGRYEDDRLLPLRSEATDLLRGFEGHERWGWKDPRTSLTLPFWLNLIPSLKVLICVRSPLEVALSLRKRAMSSHAFSLNLWQTYYERLLATLPEDRFVITHYESYFYRPTVEWRRVLDLLRLPASDQLVARARSSTLKDLRHHVVTSGRAPEAVIPSGLFDLYYRLCEEAGWSQERQLFAAANRDAVD